MTADLSAVGGQSSWVAAKPAALKPAKYAVLRKVSPSPKPGETAEVAFELNPERITLSHTYKTEGATGASFEEQIKNLGFLEMTIDKVVFFGEDIKSKCNLLLLWSCPVPAVPAIGIRSGPTKDGKPPEPLKSMPVGLQLIWGSGLSYRVSLRTVAITYVRFVKETGVPTRAEVRLNLYANMLTALPPTNPTSGGPAGRSTRVLDSSECLPSLAAASYGRPGAWRGIARANGIDDPLRIRPGTVLYLPGPGELAAGADGMP